MHLLRLNSFAKPATPRLQKLVTSAGVQILRFQLTDLRHGCSLCLFA